MPDHVHNAHERACGAMTRDARFTPSRTSKPITDANETAGPDTDTSQHDFKNISIVVLSYNRIDALRTNLPNLCDLAVRSEAEVIVVDNHSTDGSATFIEECSERYPELIYIQTGHNLGVSQGRNRGWARCTRDFILNLDDDTEIASDMVYALLEEMKHRPSLGIISPQVVRQIPVQVAEYGSPPSVAVANFQGACHLIRSAAVREVGLLDPRIAFGGEELEYSIRMRNAGYDIRSHRWCYAVCAPRALASSESLGRRRAWLNNYCYILTKYLPLGMSSRYVARYSISQCVSAIKQCGVGSLFPLLGSAIRGCIEGRKLRQPVADEVVRYYSSPYIQPDCGNIPIYVKLRRRLLPAKARAAIFTEGIDEGSLLI